MSELPVAESQWGSRRPILLSTAAVVLAMLGFERIIHHLSADSLWLKAGATVCIVAAWKCWSLAVRKERPEFILTLYKDRLDVRVSLFQGLVRLNTIRRIDDQRASFGIVKIYLATGETIQFQPWQGSMEVLTQAAQLAGLPALDP